MVIIVRCYDLDLRKRYSCNALESVLSGLAIDLVLEIGGRTLEEALFTSEEVEDGLDGGEAVSLRELREDAWDVLGASGWSITPSSSSSCVSVATRMCASGARTLAERLLGTEEEEVPMAKLVPMMSAAYDEELLPEK